MSRKARLPMTLNRNVLVICPSSLFALAAGSFAHASNEAAGLAAGLGLFFLVLIAALALVVALITVFVPKVSYGRQLGVLIVFIAFATAAFALFFRMSLIDFAVTFFALSCIAALLHACLYHTVRALQRVWVSRVGAQQATQGGGPASGGPAA